MLGDATVQITMPSHLILHSRVQKVVENRSFAVILEPPSSRRLICLAHL